MPRPKVTEQSRQRVAKACIPCQSAKFKCDGLTPCMQCTKRRRSSQCIYSPAVRSYGHFRRRSSRSNNREHNVPASKPSAAQSSTLRHSPTLMSQEEDKTSRNSVNPDTLYDTQGRIVYLGECAAPAFIRQLQNVLDNETTTSSEHGSSSRLTAIEEITVEDTEACGVETPADANDLEELVGVFFTSSCGIIDIIDREDVCSFISSLRDGMLTDPGERAVLLLILAYASQARSSGSSDHRRMRYYYHHGRELALLRLTDEPRLETVQAFLLIALYMLGCSQRNGSFLNLGIAISAAKSLGIHRDDINASVASNRDNIRTRIWRSLRYHDLFFCAMMGRTPLTMTTDSAYHSERAEDLLESRTNAAQHLAMLESTRALSVLEQMVSETYRNDEPSLTRLEILTKDVQASASNVPLVLRSLALGHSPTRQEIIRNTHVACSYYFSMMILTRPFLLALVRDRYRINKTSPTRGFQELCHSNVKHGALTSIDSALYTIHLLHDLLRRGMLFNNMVLVVAWVFVASLTICSAHVGSLGHSEKNRNAIFQAEEILVHFSHHTRQGKRYGMILKKLYRSATAYVEAIEEREHRSRSIGMPKLFSLGDTNPCEILEDDARPSSSHMKLRGMLHDDCDLPDCNSEGQADIDCTDTNPSFEEALWGTSDPETHSFTMESNSIINIIDSFPELGDTVLEEAILNEELDADNHYNLETTGSPWFFLDPNRT